MFHQPDLFDAIEPSHSEHGQDSLDLPAVIERIAGISPRPRYTFMVLNLIAQAAGSNSGSAGPYVTNGGQRTLLRDWLCDSLVPMAQRDPRRRAIVAEVRSSLASRNMLPADPTETDRIVEREVRTRVRRSGRTNVSRAVSDLVRAGLLRRHYQGYRVDHHNRGAQREAVYTITEAAALALRAI